MKKVFLGLSGGLGPVIRTLPIAEKLKKIGYDVYFSVYGAQSAKLIEQKGYKHLEDTDPSIPDPKKLISATSEFYNLEHYFAQVGLLDEHFVQSWVQHRITMIEQLQADFVIADMSPHTIIAAKYLKIPSVSITQSCFHPKGESLFIGQEIPRNIPKVTPIMNKILDRLGLLRIAQIEDLSQGDIDIIPSIPELDPIYSSKIHYVGPIEDEDVTFKGQIEQLSLDSYILVYPGRLQDSSGDSGLLLLNAVKEAFQDKEQQVIVACNETLPNEWTEGLSKNIKLIPYYNRKILRQAQLFIHHGGHGSCLAAIKNGVPSLILPTHTERLFNARKVQQIGVGDYMLPKTTIGEYLYKMSKYIIMNNEFKGRLMILKQQLEEKNYRGSEQVIEIMKQEGILV